MPNNEQKTREKNSFHLHAMEIIILLISLVLLYIIYPGMRLGAMDTESHKTVEVMYLILIFFVIGLLILTRIVARRSLFLVLANLFFWAWVGGLYLISFRVLKEIKADSVPGLFEWGAFLPVLFTLVKVFLYLILPFLLGLYFARKDFRYWKYFLGVIVAFAALAMIIERIKLTIPSLVNLTTILHLLFMFILIRLPLQRKAFERLFGFSLKPGKKSESLESGSFLHGFIAHASLLQLFILVVLFTISGIYERRLTKILKVEGPAPLHTSPALKNAYQGFKELYVKKRSPRIPLCAYDVSPKLKKLLDLHSPETLDNLWQDINEDKIQKALEQVFPYIQALEQAKSADYCTWHEPGEIVIPDFYNFREACLFLGIRAMLKIHHEKIEEALDDIETIFHTAWLLNTDGSLVNHMVGAAIRNIGLCHTYNVLTKYRNDPEALSLVENMLSRIASKVRISFDIQNMMRHEPALWAVVPYPEISAPGFKRAYIHYYASWVKFDQLALAIALEKFRIKQGHYPDLLDELSPQYIERIPRDPYEGKSYIYEKGSGEYQIRCEFHNSPMVREKMGNEELGFTFIF